MPDFFDQTPYPEPAAQLTFSGGRIIRQSEYRNEDTLARAIGHPQAQIMLFSENQVLVRLNGAMPDTLLSLAASEAFQPDLQRSILLGLVGECPLLAAPFEGLDDVGSVDLPENIKAIEIRSVAMQNLVSRDQMGYVAYGAAMLAWHASHRFCSACGQESHPAAGGAKRICSACSTEHFPRTDPAVIMLALDGDYCLMGRSLHWSPGVYSALAGFVEPGETLEDAVRREILEEAGIKIGRVMYHANQPWPFPHSLMIGCYAEARSREISIDHDELDDCRWFSRAEVQGILQQPERTDFAPPSKMSIAHYLLQHWAQWRD